MQDPRIKCPSRTQSLRRRRLSLSRPHLRHPQSRTDRLRLSPFRSA